MLLIFILIASVLIPSIALGECPSESYEWQSKCYFFQKISTGFPDAETKCVSLFGGHLTSIHDGFTNALVTEQAGSHFQQNEVKDFWIGLSNLATPGNWSWMDNTNLDFSEWDSSQPSNASMNNCVAINQTSGKWKTDACLKQKPYVCVVSKQSSTYSTTTTPPTSPSTSPPTSPSTTFKPIIFSTTTPFSGQINCSAGFTYFPPTHSCYGLSSKHQYSIWSLSENDCKKMNGHLSSIHSEVELSFVVHLTDELEYFPWSGLSSKDDGNSWQWSDGSSLDYMPWVTDTDADGNCVYLTSEGFKRMGCLETGAIICKIKLL